jgi:hypothetical protein
MPQAGRRGKPRLRGSFALPAPGLPAWPRLRAEILQIKLAHMGYSPGLRYPLQMSKLQRHFVPALRARICLAPIIRPEGAKIA